MTVVALRPQPSVPLQHTAEARLWRAVVSLAVMDLIYWPTLLDENTAYFTKDNPDFLNVCGLAGADEDVVLYIVRVALRSKNAHYVRTLLRSAEIMELDEEDHEE